MLKETVVHNIEPIAERFRKQIYNYNQEATVQKQIVKDLLSILKTHCQYHTFHSVLELGCGTGMLTQSFLNAYGVKKYCLNDLVEEYSEVINNVVHNVNNTHFYYRWGDAQTLEWNERYSSILSSSAFQWFENPAQSIQKYYALLEPNGVLALSFFTQNTYKELREVGIEGLQYPSLESLKNEIDLYMDEYYLENREYTLYFDSPIELFRHIQKSGVTGCSYDHQKGATSIRKALKYWNNYTQKRYSLTYESLFLIAKK